MLTKEQRKKGECIWKPTPKQQVFLSTQFQEVLYGGAAGAGKSDALMIDMMGLHQNALHWSKYRAILFRKTFPELGELVDRSRQVYPKVFPGAVYNTTEHEWRFPSGAKIQFSYMDKDDDRYKHQGSEYQWIGFDELTHWASPVCYQFMQSRLRSTNPEIKCYMRAGTNPGGRGHAWVKDYWRIGNDGKSTAFAHITKRDKYTARVTRQFISARLDDNPHLSETGYRDVLLKLPEKDRKKLLDGRWDIIEGQYFTAWNPAKHIIEPFVIPPNWPRWRGMDWGKTRPYSIGYYTIDPDGIIYRYKELYGWGGEPNKGTSESVSQVARRMQAIEEPERSKGIVFRRNPADPSCWYSKGEGITITELFRDSGFTWTPAKGGSGSRINGWNVCNQRLHDLEFKVFSNCKHFIRTVPMLQIDESRPEDLDTNMEDHVADEWRYALISRVKYQKERLPKQKAGYMTFDYVLEQDQPTIEKSKYRL